MKTICVYLLAATVVQADESSTQIAVSFQNEGRSGIYVMNADGTGQLRLTKASSDILPKWSPDGKQIAFLSIREQDHELAAEHDLAFHWFLYVMDADGQNQRRVIKTPIGMIFQWSPDGSRFVFESSCEDRNNKGKDGIVSSAIYVMKADGTQQKRLTTIEAIDSFPTWSPDGQQIAFCSNRDGNMDIFAMNTDGSGTKRLTDDAADDEHPIWSPDGKQIAFTSHRKRDCGSVYVVTADGTRESWLSVSGSPVAWSPDGKTLLVASDRQIAISGADGRNRREMTKAGDGALDAEYSPDGNAVLYRSKVNGKWLITSVEIERLSRKRIWSDTGIVNSFSVSPLRRAIAWRDFSSAKFKELRGQNKSVLVFCQADWDLTAKVLDRTLFADKRVINAVKQLEYIPLRADFTQRSAEIEGFLRDVGGRLGEATIVVFHGPKHEAPIVLQMKSAAKFISTQDLLDAMKR